MVKNHALYERNECFCVSGEISEKDIMEIEEKVCKKNGLNPFSVFIYSKFDFKRLKKN